MLIRKGRSVYQFAEKEVLIRYHSVPMSSTNLVEYGTPIALVGCLIVDVGGIVLEVYLF